ncbi:MAG: inositol monophosphatase family protein [Thermodesulfobacteriota bacterium]
MEKINTVALGAAYQSCQVLRERFGKRHTITKKGGIDLVTEADLASEKIVCGIIREAFPDHAILAEESGGSRATDGPLWIIDPLDGTTNFAHGLPLFAVSIAFLNNGCTRLGLVANPITGEVFSAVKGQGAFRNGEQIHVSPTPCLSESLLVTGFPYDLAQRLDGLVTRFSRCLGAAQGVRRLGSAALDLCFVACGRFDGFWEESLKPWDTAAGALIATEAGGRVTDFSRGPWNPFSPEILATNGRIHDEMSDVV